MVHFRLITDDQWSHEPQPLEAMLETSFPSIACWIIAKERLQRRPFIESKASPLPSVYSQLIWGYIRHGDVISAIDLLASPGCFKEYRPER